MNNIFYKKQSNCLLLVAISILASACAPVEEWVDEAKLHDGRSVEVKRSVAFHFGGGELSQALNRWPDQYSLEAKNPETGKLIKWSGEKHVAPIMLDFVNGTPFLVVMSKQVFSNEMLYGCPDMPYVFLKFDVKTSQWTPVSADLAPKMLRMANLSTRYDGAYMKNGKRQTKEFISRRYEADEYTSGGFFNAVIPRNYESWRSQYKLSYKNERFKNDCRPPMPTEAKVVLPKPQNVILEILEINEYRPIRVIERAEWSNLVFDTNRSEYSEQCKSLFTQADVNQPWLGNRFVKDITGQNKVPYNKNDVVTGAHKLCDTSYILYFSHLEIPNEIVITKYSLTGNMLYRISFQKPQTLKGFIGYFNTPSIKSENGFLNFEWWDFREYNQKWELKRTIKARIQEPKYSE